MTETNTLRTREYMTIKRSINSCENILQLETMRKYVDKYSRFDKPVLKGIYDVKELELSNENLPTYAMEEGKDHSPATYYKKEGRKVTTIWSTGITHSIEVRTDSDVDIDQFYICHSSEFNEVMDKILTLINSNNGK